MSLKLSAIIYPFDPDYCAIFMSYVYNMLFLWDGTFCSRFKLNGTACDVMKTIQSCCTFAI